MSEQTRINGLEITEEDRDACVSLTQTLLRFDTTNPPGDELECARYVESYLADAGLAPTLLESKPGRANVVARLKAQTPEHETLPPVLLCAHMDVVPADLESWTHPPFGGEIHDGWLWGRGAVDMKNMLAMSMVVMKRLKASGAPLRRDVIIAAVADEEAGCDEGSRFLVDEHPDLVRAEFMLGEVGGFTMHMGPLRIYPVQVAEKGVAWLKMTATGTPGHGSMPIPDSSVVKLSEAIAKIAHTRLPVHPTEVMERFFARLGEVLPKGQGLVLGQLANPRLAGPILKILAKKEPSLAKTFSALLSNTASPTVLRGGSKVNVIPGKATVELDGRTLPGQTADDLVRELKAVIDADAHGLELEITRDAPPVVTDPEGPLMDAIGAALQRHDPGCIMVPYMIPGFTDAKSFSRLGTRCYGFSPVRLPADGPAFSSMFHNHDERIPVDGLRWGVGVLYDVVHGFCAS